jgi:hypothetical protein
MVARGELRRQRSAVYAVAMSTRERSRLRRLRTYGVLAALSGCLPSRTVGDDAELTRLSKGQCHADAPAGWTLAAVDPYQAADITEPEGKRYAAWGILYVDRALQGIYADSYGDIFADPAGSMRSMANAIAAEALGVSASFAYTSEPATLQDFSYRYLESEGARALVIYRLYSGTAGTYVEGDNYIESAYFAVTKRDVWDADWEKVALVAASIRCTVQYRSPPGGEVEGSGDDSASNEDYNAILGTEYVHDSNCTNYLVSNEDWSENGPGGPGYYRWAGYTHEKLEPGRCD